MPDQTIEQKIKDLADRAYCRNCLHYIRVNYDSINNVVNRQGFCLLGRCEGDFSLYVSCGCSECMGYVLSKEHYDITFAEKKIDRESEAFAESCEDKRTANYKVIEPLRAETRKYIEAVAQKQRCLANIMTMREIRTTAMRYFREAHKEDYLAVYRMVDLKKSDYLRYIAKITVSLHDKFCECGRIEVKDPAVPQ